MARKNVGFFDRVNLGGLSISKTFLYRGSTQKVFYRVS